MSTGKHTVTLDIEKLLRQHMESVKDKKELIRSGGKTLTEEDNDSFEMAHFVTQVRKHIVEIVEECGFDSNNVTHEALSLSMAVKNAVTSCCMTVMADLNKFDTICYTNIEVGEECPDETHRGLVFVAQLVMSASPPLEWAGVHTHLMNSPRVTNIWMHKGDERGKQRCKVILHPDSTIKPGSGIEDNIVLTEQFCVSCGSAIKPPSSIDPEATDPMDNVEEL